MTDNAPFRILSHADFLALPRADKLRYLERALEAHKILMAQIATEGQRAAAIAGTQGDTASQQA